MHKTVKKAAALLQVLTIVSRMTVIKQRRWHHADSWHKYSAIVRQNHRGLLNNVFLCKTTHVTHSTKWQHLAGWLPYYDTACETRQNTNESKARLSQCTLTVHINSVTFLSTHLSPSLVDDDNRFCLLVTDWETFHLRLDTRRQFHRPSTSFLIRFISKLAASVLSTTDRFSDSATADCDCTDSTAAADKPSADDSSVPSYSSVHKHKQILKACNKQIYKHFTVY